MPASERSEDTLDLFVIGGGINGCGIARDASGRGLRVALAEMKDLGSATSSASTKLFHGGLRYLEYFELRLVREALIERETLLRAMPHIAWPMRFILPYHGDQRFESDTPVSRILSAALPWMRGRRPAWLIRAGLFLYDHMGGRKLLPPTRTVDLTAGPEGAPLKDEFTRAFEYSDCWVEDSRLVALNARDAEAHGANIMPRTRVTGAERHEDHWLVTTRDEETGERGTHRARMLVNAAGPWVGEILGRTLHQRTGAGVRLVRGSHIVTRRLFEHEKAYFFQGGDGRIIFAIPYETDFTLIGTTDVEHPDPDTPAICTPEEQRYLLDFASQYFERPLSDEDVVWTFSGVRPLYDDGARSATAATRDYTLKVDAEGGAPVLNVFGGKITTYRRLAESALALIAQHIEGVGADWTAGTPLPGGQFELREKDRLIMRLREEHPFLDNYWARRLIRAYGLDAWPLLAGATTTEELGADFGATLTQREVGWLMDHEFARTAEDVVWRRSKLGLRMSTDQVEALDRWMEERRRLKPEAATG